MDRGTVLSRAVDKVRGLVLTRAMVPMDVLEPVIAAVIAAVNLDPDHVCYFEEDPRGEHVFAALRRLFDAHPAAAMRVAKRCIWPVLMMDIRQNKEALLAFVKTTPATFEAEITSWRAFPSSLMRLIRDFPLTWRSLDNTTLERLVWPSLDTASYLGEIKDDVVWHGEVLLLSLERVPTLVDLKALTFQSSVSAALGLTTALDKWEAAERKYGLDAVARYCGFASHCAAWLDFLPPPNWPSLPPQNWPGAQVRFLDFIKRVRAVVSDPASYSHQRHMVHCSGKLSRRSCGLLSGCSAAFEFMLTDAPFGAGPVGRIIELLVLNGMTISPLSNRAGSVFIARAYAILFLPTQLGPRATTVLDKTTGKYVLKRPTISRHCAVVYEALPSYFPDALLPLVYQYVSHTYDVAGQVVQPDLHPPMTIPRSLFELWTVDCEDKLELAEYAGLKRELHATWHSHNTFTLACSSADRDKQKSIDKNTIKRREFQALSLDEQKAIKAKARASARHPACARKLGIGAPRKRKGKRKSSSSSSDVIEAYAAAAAAVVAMADDEPALKRQKADVLAASAAATTDGTAAHRGSRRPAAAAAAAAAADADADAD